RVGLGNGRVGAVNPNSFYVTLFGGGGVPPPIPLLLPASFHPSNVLILTEWSAVSTHYGLIEGFLWRLPMVILGLSYTGVTDGFDKFYRVWLAIRHITTLTSCQSPQEFKTDSPMCEVFAIVKKPRTTCFEYWSR
ncbi:MAG: hypothetical protein GY820_32395, partial [Gammaproteobacteria bacterium]|nr:hypothetical protein [Gammaproteobacteria bacterium]